ncbi:hypothetical protein AMIS_24050 [Actinoplanes missouriensis 431]|uniref:Integrase n=2 Tax=Actinoplanes missouriensis TaxID=1866 RepID=I0H3N8_ACTM4|nr:hypothetical protein AMIS_24050 [Actinoplanes missouriensis 431]
MGVNRPDEVFGTRRVAAQQVSAHWLRHTTLTWVERHFSYAVARAYAGHTNAGDIGTTVTYIKATLHEIAQALAVLTGEPHPLAEEDLIASTVHAPAHLMPTVGPVPGADE